MKKFTIITINPQPMFRHEFEPQLKHVESESEESLIHEYDDIVFCFAGHLEEIDLTKVDYYAKFPKH